MTLKIKGHMVKVSDNLLLKYICQFVKRLCG